MLFLPQNTPKYVSGQAPSSLVIGCLGEKRREKWKGRGGKRKEGESLNPHCEIMCALCAVFGADMRPIGHAKSLVWCFENNKKALLTQRSARYSSAAW